MEEFSGPLCFCSASNIFCTNSEKILDPLKTVFDAFLMLVYPYVPNEVYLCVKNETVLYLIIRTIGCRLTMHGVYN